VKDANEKKGWPYVMYERDKEKGTRSPRRRPPEIETQREHTKENKIEGGQKKREERLQVPRLLHWRREKRGREKGSARTTTAASEKKTMLIFFAPAAVGEKYIF